MEHWNDLQFIHRNKLSEIVKKDDWKTEAKYTLADWARARDIKEELLNSDGTCRREVECSKMDYAHWLSNMVRNVRLRIDEILQIDESCVDAEGFKALREKCRWVSQKMENLADNIYEETIEYQRRYHRMIKRIKDICLNLPNVEMTEDAENYDSICVRLLDEMLNSMIEAIEMFKDDLTKNEINKLNKEAEENGCRIANINEENETYDVKEESLSRGENDYYNTQTKNLRMILNAVLKGYEGVKAGQEFKLLQNKKGDYQLTEYDMAFMDCLVDIRIDDIGKALRNKNGKVIDCIQDIGVIDFIYIGLMKVAQSSYNKLAPEKVEELWKRRFADGYYIYARKCREVHDVLQNINGFIYGVMEKDDYAQKSEYLNNVLSILKSCEEKLKEMYIADGHELQSVDFDEQSYWWDAEQECRLKTYNRKDSKNESED